MIFTLLQNDNDISSTLSRTTTAKQGIIKPSNECPKKYVSSGDSNSSLRSKRKLTWAPKVTVLPILPVTTFPSSVIDSIWYTPKEYAEIKQENMDTLQLVTMGHSFTRSELEHDHCLRGLELKTREESQVRRELKFSALISVLEEQERQMCHSNFQPIHTTSTVNAEGLAHVYSLAAAAKSRNIALVQGLKDEQEVHDYLYQEEDEHENKENNNYAFQNNFFGTRHGPQQPQETVGVGLHCRLPSRICGAAA